MPAFWPIHSLLLTVDLLRISGRQMTLIFSPFPCTTVVAVHDTGTSRSTNRSRSARINNTICNRDRTVVQNRRRIEKYCDNDDFVLREREMFYLTTHSTHFIYGYMASDIWLRTILIVRKEIRCRHIGYSFRLTARVLLYAPFHRQDNTYHGLCYTSRWNEK